MLKRNRTTRKYWSMPRGETLIIGGEPVDIEWHVQRIDFGTYDEFYPYRIEHRPAILSDGTLFTASHRKDIRIVGPKTLKAAQDLCYADRERVVSYAYDRRL